LDFDGSVTVTLAGLIDWAPDAVIQGTSTGFFTALAGTLVQETDLDQNTFLTGPQGTFQPLQNFETLDAAPTLNFTLLGINGCTINCVAGLTSPFNFIEIPNGTGGVNTTVIISMFGTLTDPVNNPGELYLWSGTWSADFPNQTGLQIVTELATQGFIDAPYSAAKVTTFVPGEIPEPASMLLLGSGLVGLVAARRRNKK
jgi:hypothetical protein